MRARLFPTVEGHTEARRRVSTIHRRVEEILDQKGNNTLFVAAGLATWDVDMHKEIRSHLGLRRGGSRINPAIQRTIDESKGTP